MTRPGDDARTLRARHADLADALDRAAADRPGGVARYAGRVYSGGAIPTAVPRVFLTRPLAVDVAETEGATPTLTPDATASVPVLVIGPGVPVAGDDLVARLVGGRWVAARPGVAYVGPPSTPCSPCDIPQVTLNLSWQYVNTSSGTTTVATTLAYNSGTGQWRSPNLTPTDYPTGSGFDPCWGQGSTTGIHWFTLYCGSSGFIQIDHNFHCNNGTTLFASVIASSGTGKVFSCSPFSLDWTLVAGLNADRRLIVTT